MKTSRNRVECNKLARQRRNQVTRGPGAEGITASFFCLVILSSNLIPYLLDNTAPIPPDTAAPLPTSSPSDLPCHIVFSVSKRRFFVHFFLPLLLRRVDERRRLAPWKFLLHPLPARSTWSYWRGSWSPGSEGLDIFEGMNQNVCTGIAYLVGGCWSWSWILPKNRRVVRVRFEGWGLCDGWGACQSYQWGHNPGQSHLGIINRHRFLPHRLYCSWGRWGREVGRNRR